MDVALLRRTRLPALALLSVPLLGALLPPVATAEVQVKVLPDGTKLIYNETSTQRARRTAGHLVPAPSPQLQELIRHHAGRHGLSPRLVQAVVQVESGYNERALSRKGAMGLMQLMPATAQELSVADPYDAAQNLRGGTTYLRRMLRRFSGDLVLALAAYNAGPEAVERYRDVPPYRETRDYVQKVLGLYHGTPGSGASLLVREHAREQSQKRQLEAQRAAAASRGGDPVFLTRDEAGRIVVTTTSPNPK